MTTLYTIGYQGRVIEEFLGSLQAAGVQLVLDVRQVPLSRKPGFSKNILARNLATVPIDYLHLRALGTPAELRQQVKRSHDYAAFHAAYRTHLLQEEPALHEALALLQQRPTCLLCFEQHSGECHRLVVAQELARLHSNLEIVHL